MIDALNSLVLFILSIVNNFGYLGIFLGMVLESSLIPFPSEIILIPAGALVAKSQMSFLGVLVVGTLASLVGALINYFIALVFGRQLVEAFMEKYGTFCFITKKELEKADIYFEKHGDITTFVGRLIPIVRQFISLPAGFTKMNLPKFCLFTTLGAGIWTLVLISVGYFFGSSISPNIKYTITTSLITFSLIIILIRLLRNSNSQSH